MADPTPPDPSRPQAALLVPFPDRARLGAPLPTPLTSFVGREREVAAVVGLLRRAGCLQGGAPDVRLVTLTGPGGVGKTRLALRAAEELAGAFADGAAFVDLALIGDADLVLPAVAQALGVRVAGGRPPAEVLGDALRDRALLLVVDNFEQVVAAAPLVSDLLGACPRLAVLATSRAPLRVSGEHVLPLAPLSVPDPADPPERLAEAEAVKLFVARARAADPAFALVAENAPAVAAICRRLDGLPLAVELAAAKVRVLPPAALLPRLDRALQLLAGGARDAPERQRTVRAAIAWSHDLLTPEEQALFRRLAVFVGGFTLEAAEAVAGGPDLPAADVLAGVEALEGQSLVRRLDGASQEPRFGMLETVREFGLERLAASGEEATVRDRHAAWCLALAEAAGAVLWRTDDPGVVARLEAEHANLRAALDWFAQAGDGRALLRIGAAVGRFWYLAGHHREGRAWLERALAAEEAPSPVRARALLYAGLQALGLGEGEAALRAYEAAAALARELGLADEAAVGELGQGIVLEDRGEYHAAEARFAAALPRFRQAGNVAYELTTTYHLGVAAYGRGEGDRARRLWEETLAAARARGEPVVAAWCLDHLGLLAAEQGDLRGAAAALGECWALSDAALHRHTRDGLLAGLAVLGEACGRTEAAARLLGAAETAASWWPIPPPEGEAYDRAAERLRHALGAAAYEHAVGAGREQDLDAVDADARAVLEAASAVPAPASAPPDPARGTGLTPRELEVLRLIADGLPNREVAEALFVSPRTVDNHVSNLLAKLDARSSREAVAKARRLGIL